MPQRSGIMASVTIGRSAGLAGAVIQHSHPARPFRTTIQHWESTAVRCD